MQLRCVADFLNANVSAGLPKVKQWAKMSYLDAPTAAFRNCFTLPIAVPSEKPRIFTAVDNREVRLKLGPYRIGDTVRLRCDALGGRPQVTKH